MIVNMCGLNNSVIINDAPSKAPKSIYKSQENESSSALFQRLSEEDFHLSLCLKHRTEIDSFCSLKLKTIAKIKDT